MVAAVGACRGCSRGPVSERVCGSGSRGDAKAICLFSPGTTSQVFY